MKRRNLKSTPWRWNDIHLLPEEQLVWHMQRFSLVAHIYTAHKGVILVNKTWSREFFLFPLPLCYNWPLHYARVLCAGGKSSLNTN